MDATVASLVTEFQELADPAIPLGDRERVGLIARRARHAVVHIFAGSEAGTGSFISSDGYIVTNAHVVGDEPSVRVVTFDGRVYTGQVVATVAALDPDLALVKVDGENLPFLPLARDHTVGVTAVYVGHPHDTYWASAGGTITGIAFGSYDIVFTHPNGQGASGSALLNCDGEIVGVVWGTTNWVSDLEQANEILQNDVIWDSVSYLAFFENEHRGVGVDTLRAFLSEHAPGLVEMNEAARDSAVTHMTDFDEPSLPDDLCRPCLIFEQDWYADYISENSLAKQVGFLEETLSGAEPRSISAQDRATALVVGKQTQPAVVKVMKDGREGTGSFITSDGYIITNAHVVADDTEMEVELFDGRGYVAEVIGNTYPEQSPDLALLKIEAEDLPFLQLANEVDIGETVVGVGNPLGLEWVIWGGQVTQVDADPMPGVYQEPINQWIHDDAVMVGGGSSGSPVVNLDGKIVYIKSGTSGSSNYTLETMALKDEWMRPVVIWDQATLTTLWFMEPEGIHMDLVRRFVNDRVPGLLD